MSPLLPQEGAEAPGVGLLQHRTGRDSRSHAIAEGPARPRHPPQTSRRRGLVRRRKNRLEGRFGRLQGCGPHVGVNQLLAWTPGASRQLLRWGIGGSEVFVLDGCYT